ncbi:MAG: hypothetical protein AAF719_13000 [Pseudomonadota bacterium]
MSDASALSAAKIFGSVALLVVVLWGVSRLAKAVNWRPEIGRKAVHISLGLYCLIFPWVFDHAWEVGATCALALGVFALARGRMRQSLGEGLHAVERVSYGEALFAVSVALLFWLQKGHYITVTERGDPPLGPVLYILPILILTLCDAASALVGSAYGRKTFQVEDGIKSWEGVGVFVVTAWLVSMMVFLAFTDVGRVEVILVSFITAAFGAILEAASWRGLDNLFIPLGLYFLLANLSYSGPVILVASAMLFLAALLVLLDLTRHRREFRHAAASLATLFFMIALFSGVESLITPAAAVIAYAFCARYLKPDRPEHDALNLIVVVVSIALIFFIVSNIWRVDTIYSFNLAFACLAAGIVARFGAGVGWVAGATLAALAAMSVRVVIMEDASSAALAFFAIGALGVVSVVAVGWVFRREAFRRPWVILGGASAGVGLIALPVSP